MLILQHELLAWRKLQFRWPDSVYDKKGIYFWSNLTPSLSLSLVRLWRYGPISKRRYRKNGRHFHVILNKIDPYCVHFASCGLLLTITTHSTQIRVQSIIWDRMLAIMKMTRSPTCSSRPSLCCHGNGIIQKMIFVPKSLSVLSKN